MTRSGAGLRPLLPSRPPCIPPRAPPRVISRRSRQAGRYLYTPIPSPWLSFPNRTRSTAPRSQSPPPAAAALFLRPSRPVALFLFFSLPLSFSPSASHAQSPPRRSTNPSHSLASSSFRQPQLTRPMYVLFLDSFPSGCNFDCTIIGSFSNRLITAPHKLAFLSLSQRYSSRKSSFLPPRQFGRPSISLSLSLPLSLSLSLASLYRNAPASSRACICGATVRYY